MFLHEPMVYATSEGCSGLGLIPINQRNPLAEVNN